MRASVTLASVSAKLPSPPCEVGADFAKVDRYPAHHVTFAKGVRGIPRVIYWAPVGFRPLTLNLCLPPSAVERPASGFP
jgi:hypothetical protein